MKSKLFWSLLVIFITLEKTTIWSANADCKNEPRCSITRSYKMKAADCYNRNFRSFPKCVQRDVEVMELSANRIREVTKSDLSQYPYLKFLYLADNLLVHIEYDTFENSEDLAILDLSLNAIEKLPSSIFILSSLKKLFLSQNKNINIIDALDAVKSIMSPLSLLDISFTTDDDTFTEFPRFGALPLLILLNITGNKYSSMKPEYFVEFCNLEILVNNNATVLFDDGCDCWKLNKWLGEKNVKFTPFPCSVDRNGCPDLNWKEEHLAAYNKCKDLYDKIERDSFIWKTAIGAGIGCLVLIVLLSVLVVNYCKRRCKKREVNGNVLNNLPRDETGLLHNRNI